MNRRELLKTAVAGIVASMLFGAMAMAGQHSTKLWTSVFHATLTCNGVKVGAIDVPLQFRLDCANGTATLYMFVPQMQSGGEWVEQASGPEEEMIEGIKGSAIGERYGM